MLILIHGKDTYRSIDQLKAIRNQALSKNAQIHNYNLDSFDRVKPLKILEDIKQSSELSLFNSTKKLIVISYISSYYKNYLFNIEDFFTSITNSKDDIFVFFESDKLNSTDKIYKYFLKLETKIYEFDVLTGQKGIAYTKKMSERYDLVLDTRAIVRIQEITNNDNFAINNLLNKIANFYLDKIITLDMLKKFDGITEEYRIFVITEYILKKDFNKIFRVIDNFETRGEEPLKLLAFIISQIKKALMIKDLQYRRVKDYSKYFEGSLYSVNILASQMSKWSLNDLREFYVNLVDLDHQIKSEGHKPYISIRSFFSKYGHI